MWVHIWINGGGVLLDWVLGIALGKGSLSISEDTSLPQTDKILPHVVVGDEAFPLIRN